MAANHQPAGQSEAVVATPELVGQREAVAQDSVLDPLGVQGAALPSNPHQAQDDSSREYQTSQHRNHLLKPLVWEGNGQLAKDRHDRGEIHLGSTWTGDYQHQQQQQQQVQQQQQQQLQQQPVPRHPHHKQHPSHRHDQQHQRQHLSLLRGPPDEQQGRMGEQQGRMGDQQGRMGNSAPNLASRKREIFSMDPRRGGKNGMA